MRFQWCTWLQFVQPYVGSSEKKRKNPKSYCNGIRHRSPAIIRHTIPSCQLHSSNKRWGELWWKRGKEGRWRVWGGIDKWGKMYCSCFTSWWKKTRQGTRQTARHSAMVKLQRATMHKMHTFGGKNCEKQVGIANQYILDHLLNTLFIWIILLSALW